MPTSESCAQQCLHGGVCPTSPLGPLCVPPDLTVSNLDVDVRISARHSVEVPTDSHSVAVAVWSCGGLVHMLFGGSCTTTGGHRSTQIEIDFFAVTSLADAKRYLRPDSELSEQPGSLRVCDTDCSTVCTESKERSWSFQYTRDLSSWLQGERQAQPSRSIIHQRSSGILWSLLVARSYFPHVSRLAGGMFLMKEWNSRTVYFQDARSLRLEYHVIMHQLRTGRPA